jgi:hypothetical protein
MVGWESWAGLVCRETVAVCLYHIIQYTLCPWRASSTPSRTENRNIWPHVMVATPEENVGERRDSCLGLGRNSTYYFGRHKKTG